MGLAPARLVPLYSDRKCLRPWAFYMMKATGSINKNIGDKQFVNWDCEERTSYVKQLKVRTDWLRE